MPLQFDLHPARASDIDAVAALERATEGAPHWARAVYTEIVRPPEEMRPSNLQGETVPRCLIVAVSTDTQKEAAEHRLVGFVVCAARQSDPAELESVVVAAGERRGGIGRALCEAAIRWCREQGAAEMTLEVRASSTGAIALYRGLGLVEVARRPRYYRDPDDDALMMELALRG